MGMKINAASAAILTGVSERTIRRMITDRRLRASEAPGPRRRDAAKGIGPAQWMIDTDDLIAAGLGIDMERMAMIEAQEKRSPGGILARLDRLESEIRALHTRLASVERAIRAVTRQDGQETALPDETVQHTAYPPEYRPVSPRQNVVTPPERAGRGLPDGLVSLNSFAIRHGVGDSTAKGAARDGRLPTVRGSWRVGAALVQYALDRDGQRRFIALFSSLSGYRQCGDPACACAGG